MHHLIATNLLIIALDIALLGIQYAGMFYLGGAFKPAVYGVKLRIEFSILNKLVSMTKERGAAVEGCTDSENSTNWVAKAFARMDQGQERLESVSDQGQQNSSAPVMCDVKQEDDRIEKGMEIRVARCRSCQSRTP